MRYLKSRKPIAEPPCVRFFVSTLASACFLHLQWVSLVLRKGTRLAVGLLVENKINVPLWFLVSVYVGMYPMLVAVLSTCTTGELSAVVPLYSVCTYKSLHLHAM